MSKPKCKRVPKKMREPALKQAVAEIKRRYGDKAIRKGWRNQEQPHG